MPSTPRKVHGNKEGMSKETAKVSDSDSDDSDLPALIPCTSDDEDSEDEEDDCKKPASKAKVQGKSTTRAKNNAECADMWYKLSKDEKEKHIHVMKVYLLSPFLFGQVYQDDKWINWAYECGLLTSKSSFEIRALEDKHFDAVDLIETAFNKLADHALLKNKDGLVKIFDIIGSSGVTMSQHLDKAVTCAESFLAFTNLRDKIKLKAGVTKKQGDVALLLAHNQVSDHIKQWAEGDNLVEVFNKRCKQEEDQTADKKKEGNDAFSKGKYTAAISVYTRALHVSPYNHVLYDNRAQSYLKTKDLWCALTDGRRAVVLKPEWHKAQYRYAQAFFELGNVTRAKETNRAARKICSERKDLETQFDKFEKGIQATKEVKGKANENKKTTKQSNNLLDDLPALVDAESSDTSRNSDEEYGVPELVGLEDEDTADSTHDESEDLNSDSSDGYESDESSVRKKSASAPADEKGNPKSEDKGPSDSIPAHVQARGKKALEAYHRALQTGGSTYDKRVKILLVGQDRVGKTSLSKSLRGEPFNENEPSTDGVQMIAPVKDAGTEAWRNRPSLENTTIFDHKIAVKVTRELLSTSAEPPSQSPMKDVTGDKIQEPTRVASSETFHTSREYEHPIPSTADEKRDLDRQHTKHQDVQQKTIERNREQDRENKKKSPYVAQEKVVTLPEECAFLVQEQLEKKEVDQDDKIWPVIWDFAGQDIYRAIHPIFMSSEDIYLLVSDLTKKLSAIAECRVNLGHKEYTVRACDSEDTNFDHLLRWLDLIHSLKKGGHNEKSADEFLDPPVILVGTHADRVDDPSKEIALLKKHCSKNLELFAKHIRKCLAIDNRQAGKLEDQEKIIDLRKRILELADKMPHTKKKIPLQWHHVEKEISKSTWQKKRYLIKKTFQEDIVSLYCTFDNEDDSDELIYFLHGRGTIVYHEDTSNKDGLVILDPQWLISVLCEIIKVKSHDDEPMWLIQHREELQEKGILSRQLIDHACRNQKVDVIKDSLISLMEKFNLICQWPAKENEDPLILVPCMLTTKGQEEIAMNDMMTAPVYLTFKASNYVPGGLFCRLVVLFGKWLSNPHYTNQYKLHANEARFALDEKHFLHLACYKTVVKLHILTNVSEVGITPPYQYYKEVLSYLNDVLVTLKKEYHWLHSMSEELRVRCTVCLGTNTKPCDRHEKEACMHHDCSHYIPFEAKLCCKPGNPLPREPIEPWITAIENRFTLRDTAQSHPGQSGVEKPRKPKSPSILEARRDVRLTDSVQEPPRIKQALATHHEEGATTKEMGDVQLSEAGHTLRYLQQVEADAKQVARKTDLSVALKRIASDKGFIVSDNRGSGNCMFYALSEQLAVVKGIRISHEKLRQSIVEYLKDNHTLPDGTELFNFVPGYSSWDAYLTNMAADGTWGDHVILHGAANCFKTYIHVISSLSHQHDLIISPGCKVDSSNPLVLGHVHELHFVSLIESKRGNIKDGVVDDDVLEGLSLELGDSWDAVARRLKFKDAEITAFDEENKGYSRKAFRMLRRWKEKNGSEATYRVLHDALCHKYVNRKDLSEEFCTLKC